MSRRTAKRKGEKKMRVFEKDLTLRKEGIYWTLYLGENQITCGYLEDLIDSVMTIGNALDQGDNIETVIDEYTNGAC